MRDGLRRSRARYARQGRRIAAFAGPVQQQVRYAKSGQQYNEQKRYETDQSIEIQEYSAIIAGDVACLQSRP